MKTHFDIINLWPSTSDFSTDINVNYETARKMKERNSIASHHWKAVVDAANKRGFADVTLALLAECKSQQKDKIQSEHTISF